MDKTDLIISQLLLENSRLSCRELADKLGLSINAIHKRIKRMQESGIIRSFTAKVSLNALEALVVWIFGRSGADLTKVHEMLSKHGSIYWVAVAGGNNVYVGSYLKNISELDPLIEYLKKGVKNSKSNRWYPFFRTL
ncbi:MAG: Lrp/AsnC family transcriptional regulator [Thermoproteota archaeon]